MLHRPHPRSVAAFVATLFITTILPSAALATASTANGVTPSATQTATPTPVFIVCAHTNIPNQGAPTLDIEDLERYITTQLLDRGLNHVQPCATSHIPKPPTPDIYIVGLSVDGLRRSHRTRWDEKSNRYVDDPVFGVDLSLRVGHLASARVLGTVSERRDYHLSNDDLDNSLIQKRACIYDTADYLAYDFVEYRNNGHFGPNLTPPRHHRRPEPSAFRAAVHDFLQPLATFLGITRRQTAVVLGVIFIIVLPLIALAIRRTTSSGNHSGRVRIILPSSVTAAPPLALPAPPAPAPTAQSPAAPTAPASPTKHGSMPSDDHEWDTELNQAFALRIKTDDFSDRACNQAAVAMQQELQANHARIEATEATRILTARIRDNHFENLAAYAAARSGMEPATVVDILQKADQWEFRVLQQAKKLAMETAAAECVAHRTGSAQSGELRR